MPSKKVTLRELAEEHGRNRLGMDKCDALGLAFNVRTILRDIIAETYLKAYRKAQRDQRAAKKEVGR